MNIIITLIKKDLYEYANNKKGLLFNAIFYLGVPIVLFNWIGISDVYFENMELYIHFILIIFICFLYTDTTMSQIRRDIKEGVYEKYFINNKIKKWYILASKIILNYLLTVVIIILVTILSNYIAINFVKNGIAINFNMKLFMYTTMCSFIGTCIAFITSLVMEDEKNAFAYIGILLIIIAGIFKCFDFFNINFILHQFILFFVVTVINVFIVLGLLSKNKFIKRESK